MGHAHDAVSANLLLFFRYSKSKQSIAINKHALTATGTHEPYGITQYHLPPGRGDIPTFTPAN